VRERPFTVAAVSLLRDDGAVLMQHRDDKPGLPHAGMWVPPGGHADPGESAEACARREFREETGYVCDRLHFLEHAHVQIGDGRSFELAMFWAVYDGVQQTVCHEGQALEFIRREDADAYPIPAFIVPMWDRALRARRASAEPGVATP
jgi:8-oxo-dGTP pyrophosphatase MutT (NUDIX family)